MTHADLADARAVYGAAFAAGVRPPPHVKVSEWAERNRVLSEMESPNPGEWRNDRTPFLVEIMDAMSPSDRTEEGTVMKGTQMGVSEVGINFLGCLIDQHPSAIMMVRPTSLEAKRYNRVKLDPAFESTDCLRGKIKEVKSRDRSNSALLKQFQDGVLVLAGANSATELSSMPVKYMVRDEIDRYPLALGREGDPIEISGRRTTNFPRHKILNISSPTEAEFSRIEEKFKEGDQRRYFVPCPHCYHKQYLRWNQIKFAQRKAIELHCRGCGVITPIQSDSALVCPECGEHGDSEDRQEELTDEVIDAWYECEACRERIDEHHKTWFLALENGAEWIPQQPNNGRHKSWHLPALYAPLSWTGNSWKNAAAAYLKALRDPEKMREFTNFILGEPYEPGDAQDPEELKQRIDDYWIGQAPAGVLVLTAAVDVQGDRLEYKVKGYGRGEESWLVDYQVIWGDTARDEIYDQLDELLLKKYPHAGGTQIGVTAAAIDSGYHTHEVYNFVRRAKHRNVIAIKGKDGPGRTALGRPTDVDVNHRGKTIKGGCKVWPVGVDTLKDSVHARLAIETPGPKYMHFPQGLPDDYFKQLTAERKKLGRDSRGRTRTMWVLPKGHRNEAGDLENYCYAAAIFAGITAMTDAKWDRLEKYYNPNQQDLFRKVEPGEAAADKPQQTAETKTEDRPENTPAKTEPQPAAKPRGRRVRGRIN